MADSYIDFGVDGDLAGDQLTGVFDNLTMDYLSTAHFGVVITNGATGVKTTLTSSQFAVATSPNLKVTLDFSAIPEYSVLAAADTVRITRTTPVSALERTFTDGSVLKASDLTAQHKQLLFAMQESVDGGIGSLPIDTDGMYEAGSRRIKNLGSPTETHHATTKEYVDGKSLYGSAFGGVDPQYWTFTTANVDEVGDNRVFTFPTDNVPASTTDNMFLIEVGGVIQDPAAYNVTLEDDGDYQLTLVGGEDGIANGETIIVRNFGVSRNIVEVPFTNLTDAADALTVKRLSGSTTGNLFIVTDESAAHLVSVDKDGHIRVGSATDEDTNTSIRGDKVEVGDYNTDGSDGVEISRLTGNKGFLGISSIGTAPDGDEAVSIYRGTTQVFKVAYDGDITTAGGATFGDTVKIKGSGSDGLLADDSTTYPGRIYFGSGGPNLYYDATHYIQAQSGKVQVAGNLQSDGTITSDSGLISGDVMKVKGSGTDGIISTDMAGTGGTAYLGRFYHSTAGPALRYEDSSGTLGSRLIARSNHVTIEDGYLDMGSNQIKSVADPTGNQHAATKKYVDDQIGWRHLATKTWANDGSVELVGSDIADEYSELKVYVEYLYHHDASEQELLFQYKRGTDWFRWCSVQTHRYNNTTSAYKVAAGEATLKGLENHELHPSTVTSNGPDAFYRVAQSMTNGMTPSDGYELEKNGSPITRIRCRLDYNPGSYGTHGKVHLYGYKHLPT